MKQYTSRSSYAFESRIDLDKPITERELDATLRIRPGRSSPGKGQIQKDMGRLSTGNSLFGQERTTSARVGKSVRRKGSHCS